MGFSKNFPIKKEGTPYTEWKEIRLTEKEEKRIEEEQRKENIILMNECIRDAEKILKDNNKKDFQSDVIRIAISLFEKRASHLIYWKEEKAKEKLDNEEKSK